MSEYSFSIWRDWFPEDVAKEARVKEPGFLAAWADALATKWKALEGDGNRSVEISKWTGIFTEYFSYLGCMLSLSICCDGLLTRKALHLGS